MDKHKKLYKARIDPTEARNTRNNTTIELRQNRRDNIIEEKRMMCSLASASKLSQDQPLGDVISLDLDVTLVNKLLHDAVHSELSVRRKSTETIRQHLSIRDKSQPFEIFIDNGLIPTMLNNIKIDDFKLKFESLWVLTNVASGPTEYTQQMTSMGCIPILVECLAYPDYRIIDQAIWTLGNIIGDGPLLRNECLKNDLINALIHVLNNKTNQSVLKTISWVTINICRGKDNPVENIYIEQIIQLIHSIIKHDDNDSIRDSMWALNYLVDSSPHIAFLIIQTGFIQYIIGLVDRNNSQISETVIRCLGNIAAGTDDLTQYVISLDIVPMIIKVLSAESSSLVHETLWLISNIVAGTKEQLQFVFQDQILTFVIYFAINGCTKDQREALWVISNIVNNGTVENVKCLIELDVLDAISIIIKSPDNKIIAHALETLVNIFKICADSAMDISKRLEESGAFDTILKLQFNSASEISDLSKGLIDKYIVSDYENNDIVPEDYDMTRSEFNF